jgi:hypothetical protein
MLLVLPILLLLTTACSATPSAFARTASNAGSAFAAAEMMLVDVHEGRLLPAYAHSGFANYQSELLGLDRQLTAQQGAPGARTIHHLLDLYTPAMRALDYPCLDTACDWRAQDSTLKQASEAFLEVGSG